MSPEPFLVRLGLNFIFGDKHDFGPNRKIHFKLYIKSLNLSLKPLLVAILDSKLHVLKTQAVCL